jgi:O-antigen ligase
MILWMLNSLRRQMVQPLQLVKNPCLPYLLVFPFSLQSHCRCYLAHSQYVRLMKATITAQCAWRGRMARRELRNLKMVSPLLRSMCLLLSFFFNLCVTMQTYSAFTKIIVKFKHRVSRDFNFWSLPTTIRLQKKLVHYRLPRTN